MHQINIFFIINPTYFIYLILPHPITLCYNKIQLQHTKKEQQDHPVTLDQFINASKHLAIWASKTYFQCSYTCVQQQETKSAFIFTCTLRLNAIFKHFWHNQPYCSNKCKKQKQQQQKNNFNRKK